MLRRLRHSIRWRLVAVFVVLALCTGLVFLAGLQRLLQGGWQGYARPMVGDYVDRLAAEIGSPPDTARAAALAARLPVTIRIEGPTVNWRSHPHDDGHTWRRGIGGRPPHDDADEAGDRGGPADAGEGYGGFGLVRQTADGHRLSFGLVEPPDESRPRRFGWIVLGVLLLLTGGAFVAVRRLLRPLEPIAAGVEAYGRGEFGTPIAVARADELGDLASRINTMAARLHGMLEAKRALLLAISHELRSPLTRARLNAELVPEGPARDALLRDLAEMRDLITSLLEGERLAQGHAALQPEAIEPGPWLREELEAWGGRDPVDLRVEVDPDAPLRLDPMRVRLLIRNLLANAERHATAVPGASGTAARARPAQLFLRRSAAEPGRLELGVRDFGPGVPEAELPRLAEAFYRPDSARTRAAGGVGLGLHLCRLVAEAHGGTLRVRNASPGLEVAMVWPDGGGP